MKSVLSQKKLHQSLFTDLDTAVTIMRHYDKENAILRYKYNDNAIFYRIITDVLTSFPHHNGVALSLSYFFTFS